MDTSQRGHCGICRGQLAGDNSTGTCSACSGRNAPSGPPVDLPVTFWNDPDLCQALGERHMGKVIAAYRANHGHRTRLRQSDVAEWAGLTQVRLSHIENGPPIMHLDKLIFWAVLLHIPPNLLWFQLPGHTRRAPSPAPANSPVPVVGSFRLLRIGGSGHGEDPDVATMRAFRSCDSELGGGHLYREVLLYLTTDIGPRLFGGDESTSREVFTAAAGLTEMAGWMAHDGGNDQQAYRHFQRARELAKTGGDRQLLVHVHASLAHLALHLEQPREAIRHAYEGEMALRKAPHSPELAARLWAMQARGFAALDQRSQAHKLLDQATRALADAGPSFVSPWVSRFDLGALSSEAARCWRQMGDLNRARGYAEHILVVRAPERARSRAFAQLTLATIHAQQGDPDQASTVGAEVFDSAKLVTSSVIVRHLSELHQHLQPYRTAAGVGEFLDRLGAEMRNRSRTQPWSPPSGR